MKLVWKKPSEAAPQRLAPIARLPLFLDLAGKRAVVAGGSSEAAQHVEQLLAAGAEVLILAPSPEAEMAALIAREAEARACLHAARCWTGEDLDGACIALCDRLEAADAAAFCEAARGRGVLAGVIDRPETGAFRLGTIVARSPLVIGMSTDGQAPAIERAIRQRLEMLLPPWLAEWVRLAGSMRRHVAERLPPGAVRRGCWSALARLAFTRPPSPHELAAPDRLVHHLADSAPRTADRVTLVGAGPGSADLLTVRALRAIEMADVILYDDLVCDEVLDLARREARRMLVGKRGQRASCAQEDINALMVSLARQGRHVVRLKSGDPTIFGRAGEEIACLAAEGIEVDIVPGVTSAAALAACLGVSLTHRDHAHSVRFVTGHARSGELDPDLDWRGLADRETTLIVYMGRRTAAMIARRLIEEGLDRDTPVVAVGSVSRPDEQRWTGPLAMLAATGLPDVLDGPVVIGIGTVFSDARCDVEPAAPLASVHADQVASGA